VHDCLEGGWNVRNRSSLIIIAALVVIIVAWELEEYFEEEKDEGINTRC
jgi:hypothetical protein